MKHISFNQAERKKQLLMEGSYEPTLADSIFIYKKYSVNTGSVSSVLADTYKWLSHEPLSNRYEKLHGKGTLYARHEVLSRDKDIGVHFVWIDDEPKHCLEGYFTVSEEDITETPLVVVCSDIAVLIDKFLLEEQIDNGEYEQ